MKGVFAVPVLVAALLCTGSPQPGAFAASASVDSPTARPGPAGERAMSSARAAELPFRGRFTGSQSVTPLAPPLASVDGSATGTATLLGLFTVEFPHVVNFATRIGEGTYTFTAANGDTLTGEFVGQASGAPPLISIVEQVTITGGTGRFAGASGTITVERQFDQASGMTDASFDGTLSSVGASHP